MIQFRDSKWEGLDGLVEEELKAARVKGEKLMKAALVYFEGQIKQTLTGRRSGREYKVSKTGRLHIASAPGEPPAVLFGNLRNSVGHSGPRWDGDTLEGEVGPGLGTKPAGPADQDPESYARRLEFGGVDSRGVRILPRPYMDPTELRVSPHIERMFEAGL